MKEIGRVIENQATLYGYRATQNEDRALQLELAIELSKPKDSFTEWHPLIATPFRYNPPHPHARFRPPYGKNVFYGAFAEETALYEHAYYFMKERMHLPVLMDTGTRTIFFVEVDDKNAIDIKKHPNLTSIMQKNDYSASHQFVVEHPDNTFIIYPSVRDPKQRDNAAILDIRRIEKMPKWEASIKFFYDNQMKVLTWIDYQLHIAWEMRGSLEGANPNNVRDRNDRI